MNFSGTAEIVAQSHGQVSFRDAREPVRVAVVGATGYAGCELISILARHPEVRITRLMSSGREGGEAFSIEKSHPVLRANPGLKRCPESAGAVLCEPLNLADLTPSEADLIFLATPHEISHTTAPALVTNGFRVIDLSGAFRLKDAGAYPRWYGFEHRAAAALEEAVYGCPELNASLIQAARLVANPGCYATSIILALAPLLRAGWVEATAGVICDAKSGASGAGRVASEKLQFAEVNENCRAYSLFNHRHIPEMLQALCLEETQFTFTPHLLPITRGILSTIYLRLSSAPQVTAADIQELYKEFYASAPMVRVYENGTLPEIQAVSHTNYADLGFAFEPATRRLVVVSALDNLGKGAAGQAVENMNLMCGFPQARGLA